NMHNRLMQAQALFALLACAPRCSGEVNETLKAYTARRSKKWLKPYFCSVGARSRRAKRGGRVVMRRRSVASSTHLGKAAKRSAPGLLPHPRRRIKGRDRRGACPMDFGISLGEGR